MVKTYVVNEVFYAPQGEGVRAGTMNVFVRFSGCNLACSTEAGPRSPGGFNCDTEFVSGRRVTAEQLAQWCREACFIAGKELPTGDGGLRATGAWLEPWIIFTGGEPALQVKEDLCGFFHDRGVRLAMETNGTIDVASRLGVGNRVGLDWLTVSPKVAEHAINCTTASEVKYVRGYGQAIPKTVVTAGHYLISPAMDNGVCHPKTLAWCIGLVAANPQWRLSVQQHHGWKVR